MLRGKCYYRGSAVDPQLGVKMKARKPPQAETSSVMRFRFEIEQEVDGRWMAEIPEVPGAMAYGATEAEAKANAYALALYAIADDAERSHQIPESISVTPATA